MSKRQNTKLESEGAEFLVLGNLLANGIECYKAYVNFPGYDLFARNPKTEVTARIQVKSRWATNYDKAFLIKNIDKCDFVVLVALNRGYSFGKRPSAEDTGTKSPEFYILPVNVLRKARDRKSSWRKVHLKNVPGIDKDYKEKWHLIRDFLTTKKLMPVSETTLHSPNCDCRARLVEKTKAR